MTKGQNILAGIVICAFAAITIIAFATEIMSDIRGEIIMAWVVNFTTVIGYRFGSSQSSSDKNSMIAKKLGGD